MIAPLLHLIVAAQLQGAAIPLTGDVRDSATHAPVVGATVTDLASRRRAITNASGRFEITVTPPARLRFERSGFATREIDVASLTPITVELAASARALEKMTVTALRGGANESDAPISQRTLTRQEIERRYFGQDVPLVLQSAPSLTAYSETGNYWGYSYIRLRGIDQSRINLTIDGIPLNDPEDQVLYFADFPDLANSIESAQIQRGVGTSSTGTASFAGSVNFETTPLATARRGTDLQIEGGSFGSKRASAEYHSGLLPRRFAFYGRLSALQTNGYREHSGVEGRSGFMSAGWFGDRDIVKLTATAGLMRDTLSYLAVPETALVRDRRINPLQPDELDRFGEQLASLAYTRLLGPSSSWSTTLYRISASGNYDVAYAPDVTNYHLDFSWYGVTSAWTWSGSGVRANAGVNANTYARDHYAYLRPDFSTPLYFNTGHKTDASGFAKLSYDVGRATLFGDLQARTARFRYAPDEHAGITGQSVSWTFVNPKVGLSYHASRTLQVNASYGRTSREPARSDMFAGFDNLDTSNVTFVGHFGRVRPETVHDLEGGITLRTDALRLTVDAFSMRFHNEIAPIGELSYLGTPLRKNVGRSYRRGVELDGSWQLTHALAATANLTVMEAQIAQYADDASGADYRDVPPLLTPRVLSSQRIDFEPTRALGLAVEGRYTGRSQLDNTGDPRMILPPSYVVDASASWRFGGQGRQSLTVRANNLLDSKKYGSGYSGEVPNYYVLPPLNFFVGLGLGF